MPAAHFVHGFNVSDGGRSTTDRIAPYFRQVAYRTVEWDYGYVLISMWVSNKRVAQSIARDVAPGDIGVGHSNGCAILTRAADMGAPLTGLVLLNPALDADIAFAPQLKWVHVYYNQDDSAVKWAEVIPHVLNRRWGGMGARGYTGKDPRVESIDCQKDQGRALPRVSGHSDIFTKLHAWGPFIAAKAWFASRP